MDTNKETELLSEQQLSGLLPPSIRYLLVLATQRHPRYLLRVLNSFDELYALCMLLIERHFLLNYGGGFTENFYGLKRERVLRAKGGEIPRAQHGAADQVREALKLRTSDVWKNLAIMVGLPYLKRKLDESYEIHAPQAAIVGPRYNRNTLPPDATLRQKAMHYYKWFLKNVYPSVNAAYYFVLLAFNVGYLFSNTAYSSPFLWMVQTRIRRLGQADLRALEAAAAASSLATPPARPGQSNSLFNPRTLVTTAVPRVLGGLKILLPTSIFALKFLEWWHASDFARQLTRKAAEGLELPLPIVAGMPPPSHELQKSTQINSVALAPESSRGVPAAPLQQQANRLATPVSSQTSQPIFTVPPPTAATSGLCPICLQEITNPTATQTGYVFCYTCIFRWVEGNHDRQAAWMEGTGGGEVWGDEADFADSAGDGEDARGKPKPRSREGRWESGKGRCAVTGRRLLAGTDGLRRVMA